MDRINVSVSNYNNVLDILGLEKNGWERLIFREVDVDGNNKKIVRWRRFISQTVYRRALETFQVRWLIYGRRVGGRYYNLG